MQTTNTIYQMMTRIKNSILAAAAVFIMGFAACSNVEDGYHVADHSNLKLSLTPQSTLSLGETGSAKNLSIINAVNGSDKVYVECPANWVVEVSDNIYPDWNIYIDKIGEDEKGRYFIYSSSINTNDERDWPNAIKVFVEGLDGEELVPQFLSVRQERSVILPTPASFEIFPASGKSDKIVVKSNDDSWEVASSVESMPAFPGGWISIDRSGKKDGIIVFTVLPNRGTSPRSGSIRFLDATGKTVADVIISQSGSNNTFDVYFSEDGNLISQDGATLSLNVLSDKGWKVECAEAGDNGWLSIEGLGQSQPSSVGSEGGAGRQISVKVAPNTNRTSREATIAFIRTEDNATENQGGVAPIYLNLIQSGTQQPALSDPWIEGIFDQKHVNIYARYYSGPDIFDSGIEIRNLTLGSDFVAIPDMDGAQEDKGLIHVVLDAGQEYSGLRYRPGYEYEIQSYIYTPFGKITSHAETFIAPGVKPSNDDQKDPDVQ